MTQTPTPQQPGQRPSRLSAHLQPSVSREATSYERFRAQIEKLRPDIAAMCGKDKVEKFIRVCLNAAQHNPDVLTADRRTLLLACLESAQDGLIPDGNEAVFNVYKTKIRTGNAERWVQVVQYLPMAYGLVQKIYESGATYVDAIAVYERDTFEYQRGDNPMVRHVPYDGSEDPGKVKAAYCVVKYQGLEPKREVMFRRDIEKVRAKSKQPDGLMWNEKDGFYDQGAIKSVIHRINKQLPQSERLRRTLQHDNRAVGLLDVADPMPDDSSVDLTTIVDGKVILVEDMTNTTAARDEVLGNDTLTGGGDAVTTGADTAAGADTAVTTGAQTGNATTTATATATDAPLPKPGDPGTPEMKAKFLQKMNDAKMSDVLDIVMDDVRFFSWSDADKTELEDSYKVRRAALTA